MTIPVAAVRPTLAKKPACRKAARVRPKIDAVSQSANCPVRVNGVMVVQE
jgi:hypothetical protein